MSIPPCVVATARLAWNWQWNQLMNGLAPCDKAGNYLRPKSEGISSELPSADEVQNRAYEQLPRLIIGRSCPWAHRTWLVYKLRGLEDTLQLIIVQADHKEGRWKLKPSWKDCDSLLSLYKLCGIDSKKRATVPVIIDPGPNKNDKPKMVGNESAKLVELLNCWPTKKDKSLNLIPPSLKGEIETWQNNLQNSVNDGVYRCGFARNQAAYEKASKELFHALSAVNKSLSKKGPWICGDQITIADIRLFPTIIRWELIYQPLFGCSQRPLWEFNYLWEWRQRFMNLPAVKETCDELAWRKDYFGALFPLRPSNIIPSAPSLNEIINAHPSHLK